MFRDKKLTYSLFVLLILSGTVFWLNTKQNQTLTKTLFAMGTAFEITATGKNAEKAIGAAFDEIKRIEALTTLNDNSQLTEINNQAGISKVKVDPAIIEILNVVKAFYPKLDQVFDPTIAPLIQLWGFSAEQNPRLPSKQAINTTLSLVNFNLVEFDPKQQTVFLTQPGMKLDFGGIAKGYAIDRAYDILKKHGIESALINGGTSSIRVIGNKNATSQWTIGIGHPRNSETLLGTINLPNDRALGTSADTQNYFIEAETRYSHLINPQTGYPVHDKILLTVTAPNATEADLLSTALFLLPPAKIRSFLKDNPQYQVIFYDSQEQLVNLNETTFQASN
ncbi:MAG TPA: FAD:protein FMN transferase [Bacillota bacterium]|jgi:thiamine biosynthesis lipoprotein|nr:FAD:protein FMN transferase [Bacillota bacterium]HOL10111.1 FAD:protein FMN transferase [Bacillota bacterium]HPO97893.1 FAD:protein FMN transferase [Bacillota bacterium]